MKNETLGRKVKVIEVTPEIAGRWLNESNTHNRPIRNSRVEEYAAAMKAGEWQLTSEPVAFCHPYTDSAGNSCGVTLINGQHRLWAVIYSKATVPFTVWWGCEPEEFKVIDQGAVRTHGDILSTTRTDLKESARIAGIVTSFLRYGLGLTNAMKLRHEHIQIVLKNFEEEIMAVQDYKKRLKRYAPREVLGALVLGQIANPSMTALMVNNLKDAVGFTERDPIRALHVYLSEQLMPGKKDTPDALFYKVCHAICARLRGEHIRVLRITGEGVGWLRDAARTRLEPVAKELFGKIPQHFWEPKLVLGERREKKEPPSLPLNSGQVRAESSPSAGRV